MACLSTCLSIAVLHVLPAFAQGSQESRDFVDDGDVEPQPGLVEAPGAVLVETLEISHHLAAVFLVERARQTVEDVDALVEALRLGLVALALDVAARTGQLF